MPASKGPIRPPRITILLCTFNGAAHLAEQLASYLAQEHAQWDLWVSDDGSTDGTLEILRSFERAEGCRRDIRLLEGPRRGPAANFLSLMCHPELPAGPVALSDQDDVWWPCRLRRALEGLSRGGPVTLYGAQSHHTDQALQVIGASRPPRRGPSFANALTQNIVSGHNAALSAGALELARRAGVPADIPYHDWWLYQLVSGAGGEVVIDDAPVLYYRQHAGNVMGAHRGLAASLQRAAQVLGRTYGGWFEANTEALQRAEALLTEDSRTILAGVAALPRGAGLARPMAFHRLGLHRQTRLATASLHLAAALGRV